MFMVFVGPNSSIIIRFRPQSLGCVDREAMSAGWRKAEGAGKRPNIHPPVLDKNSGRFYVVLCGVKC